MVSPRWMHRLWAWIAGYFWLPCQRCGEPFGGHEGFDPPDRIVIRPNMIEFGKIVPTLGSKVICSLCCAEVVENDQAKVLATLVGRHV